MIIVIFEADSYFETDNFNNALNKGSQEAERKIPLNYASRYTSKAGGLQKSAYLPFKVRFLVF